MYGVGAYQVGVPLYSVLKSYYNEFYHEKSLKERLNENYGKEGWALVTGASEGIGREYAN